MNSPRWVLASQGDGSFDAQRIRSLVPDGRPLGFDRSARGRSAVSVFRHAFRHHELHVLEGTGVGAGLPLIAANLLVGTPFVVSSGDAVGPYLRLRGRIIGRIGGWYERLLMRRSAAFVGWTPYLTGRALTLGAPRAITAPGWSELDHNPSRRNDVRAEWGFTERDVVWGIAGSLNWNAKLSYCYGVELVRALAQVPDSVAAVVIAGDGSGLGELQQMARRAGISARVRLIGRVPRSDLGAVLSAWDVASLPQSVDLVGSFRYTTKLAEYAGAGLPVVAPAIPAAYDLGEDWFLRLPGSSPWDVRYAEALAVSMGQLSPDDVRSWRGRMVITDVFEAAPQLARVAALLDDLTRDV